MTDRTIQVSEAVIRQAVEAMENSRDLIATDRQSFVDCQQLRDCRTDDPIAHGLVAVEDGVWLDSDDAEALRDYDRGLEQIDAAADALRSALRQDVQQPDDRTAMRIANGYRRRPGCTMLAIGRCPECGHIHNDTTHARATPPAAPARQALTPEALGELWDAFIELHRKTLGADSVASLLGGQARLRERFIMANSDRLPDHAPHPLSGITQEDSGNA